MERLLRLSVLVIAATAASGCVTAAPGAAEVTITRNPADVTSCSAAGNISPNAMTNPLVAQNQGGIAYRCSK